LGGAAAAVKLWKRKESSGAVGQIWIWK